MLYNLVCRVDKIEPGTIMGFNDKSNYSFVQSVYENAKENNRISKSQLEWMNKFYEQYTKRDEERNNQVDTSDIPF